jgi:hypothetical protein
MIRQLRGVAQELLAHHVNSSIEITKFLQTVFNIDKDSSGNWRVRGIKDNLLISGFPALDSVTDIARELLLKYYEGCETKYQKGVKLWLDENKDTAAVAAVPPAVAAVPPAVAAVPPAVPPAASADSKAP